MQGILEKENQMHFKEFLPLCLLTHLTLCRIIHLFASEARYKVTFMTEEQTTLVRLAVLSLRLLSHKPL